MALTATVTKASVSKLTESDYQIKMHVVIIDESANVLLEKDYSERWYSALAVNTIKIKLQNQLKVDWDRHVSEQEKYDAAQFDTMITEIQTAVNTYINS
jgi:hypothetical protein